MCNRQILCSHFYLNKFVLLSATLSEYEVKEPLPLWVCPQIKLEKNSLNLLSQVPRTYSSFQRFQAVLFKTVRTCYLYFIRCFYTTTNQPSCFLWAYFRDSGTPKTLFLCPFSCTKVEVHKKYIQIQSCDMKKWPAYYNRKFQTIVNISELIKTCKILQTYISADFINRKQYKMIFNYNN